MPKVAVVEEVARPAVDAPASPEAMENLKVEAEFAEGYTAPFCLGPARECFCCGSLCNRHHGCWYNCKQCCCDDLQLYWKSVFCMPCVLSEMVTTARLGSGTKTILYFGFCVGVTQVLPLLGWTVASRQITDTVNAATNRFGVREKVPWLCDRSETDGCRCGTFWCPYCVIVRAQMEIRHRARAGVEVGHGIYRPQPPPHVMRMSRSGVDETTGEKKPPKYVGIKEKKDPMPSQVRIEL